MKKFLLSLAFGFFSLSAHAATFTMTTVAKMEEHHEEIVQALDAETYDMLLKSVENGSQVEITITPSKESLEDGRGGDDRGAGNCTVKVTENRGGSAGANVGGKAGGNAEGHNNRTFEVSGPCREVREIVKDIMAGGERRGPPGGHGGN